MLEVSIKKKFGDFTLESSFQAGNEILGILGPSGSGKSLTLRCIAGLQTPDEGRIAINETALFDFKNNINIAPGRRNIGFVFQDYALFPHLSVVKNIGFGLKHFDPKTKDRLVSELVEKIHLKGYENHYPAQLSGGQQQRVALARTLITKPKLLLLDEPFSALDNHIKSLLEQELIQIIKNSFTGTVLLVTHNVEEAYRLCNRILVFSKGETIQIGNKEEVIKSPASLDAARITGCKNLIDAEVIKEDESFVTLKSQYLLFQAPKPKTSISTKLIAGIRAHHLQISSEPKREGNSFACEVLEFMEGVFSTTVIINCSGHILQVEISKDNVHRLLKTNKENFFLYIPPEKIFLLPSEKKRPCN